MKPGFPELKPGFDSLPFRVFIHCAMPAGKSRVVKDAAEFVAVPLHIEHGVRLPRLGEIMCQYPLRALRRPRAYAVINQTVRQLQAVSEVTQHQTVPKGWR